VSEPGEVDPRDHDPSAPDLHSQIDALRLVIATERQALRDGHDEPANQLREQAASLGEAFVAASDLALRGFERAESRLAALEQDLHGRMAQLSLDLQSVVTELRHARPQGLSGSPAAFPLEGVMRIHDELRGADGAGLAGADAMNAGLAAFAPPAPGAARALATTGDAVALTARLDSLERAMGNAAAAAASAKPAGGSRPHYPLVGLLVVVAAIAVASLWMQRRVEARLNDAAARISAAERQRDETIHLTDSRLTATRDDSARQITAAQRSAVQAQVVGNVLAAPDLVRYWLVAANTGSRAYAQVLFSRSRGMVFSASRLPPAGEGKTYQLWLLTKGGPISAGLFTPDSSGRVTLSTDVPLTVPKRLTGSLVTIEPAGGKARPSATKTLVRAR
jgi:anti-sigma-K factor RskA